jgi:hypothetical protein
LKENERQNHGSVSGTERIYQPRFTISAYGPKLTCE